MRLTSPTSAFAGVKQLLGDGFVLGWLERRGREKRVTAYVRAHPEDAPAAKAILAMLESPMADTTTDVRQVVETLAGRQILHDEWQTLRPRWERAWNHIVEG